MRLLQFVADVSESREAAPVDHVFLLGGTPIPSQETITAADDLCVEVGGEFWPVIGQAAYAEVSTEVGEGEVNILEGKQHLQKQVPTMGMPWKYTDHNGHADVVAVPPAFLGALEDSTGIETVVPL